MVYFIYLMLLSYCSASNNSFLGYRFEQQYFHIDIYEYSSYSNVQFLKFDLPGPTTLAKWSISIDTDGKCNNYFANIHFDLQHGAYPLITPQNESFPDTYIATRHDLFPSIFNRTISNTTVQLTNPLKGTWFALVFIERLSTNRKSKTSASSCNIYLTSWLDYQVVPIPLTLNLNQPLQIDLSNNVTFVYASYYTSTVNSRITVSSKWSSNCDIIILARINGLPNAIQYDYQIVCKNGSCSMELDQIAAFNWIYFQISVNNLSCLTNPIHGVMFIHSTESVFRSYPTRRIMFNNFYNFLYIPVYANNTNDSIMLNGNDLSIYTYEFIVDDRNIGGTINFDFQTELKSLISNVSILGCLSKNLPRPYDTCEIDYKILINKNSLTVRSLPYPEMARWYLTLEYNCDNSKNDCSNSSVSMTFQISSSPCTRQQCGTYGVCKIFTSQQNIFSTCSCIAGYRGYGCTDNTHAYLSKYLPSVLFLTLSNLMFIPAISLAIYHRLYIEALVYLFNMVFSTFYHACDQEIHRFCLFKYDGLQLSDFIGSYASFTITLITMSIVPRSLKVFLFMLGLLACIAINSRNRFDNLQFIAIVAITFSFTILTWIVVSIKYRRLQPSKRQLLFITPGCILSITGIILFAVVETEENYWYIHSIWHILIATSILFFLPMKRGKKKHDDTSTNLTLSTSSPSIGIINDGASLPNDQSS